MKRFQATDLRLTIISHTPHYKNSNGEIVGWGPTIREINYLTRLFDQIIHLAPLHEGETPLSSIPYDHTNIEFVALKPSGGISIKEKWSVLTTAAFNTKTILKFLKKSEWVQLRAPANIMLYTLPIFSFRKEPQRWVKYAGSWKDNNIPFTYKIQRWWLKHNLQGSIVTVNGSWQNDPIHILPFENPCLEDDELLKGKETLANKSYQGKLVLCFVGQLVEGKGIIQLLQAMEHLDKKDKIKCLHIVGDGALKLEALQYQKKLTSIELKVHGYLPRPEINKIYADSHINILPSASEGFPKVIAEGAAFGAIPIVTDMSSLSQYINPQNGRLLSNNSSNQIYSVLSEILELESADLLKMALNASSMAEKFSYTYFLDRLKKEVLFKTEDNGCL